MVAKIRALIGFAGINQAELAKRLGYSPQNLSKKMSRNNFTVQELCDIAKACDADIRIDFILPGGKEL